jgi:hypothetical protein
MDSNQPECVLRKRAGAGKYDEESINRHVDDVEVGGQDAVGQNDDDEVVAAPYYDAQQYITAEQIHSIGGSYVPPRRRGVEKDEKAS